MYKYLRIVLLILLVALSLQQVAIAAEINLETPIKPTDGVESRFKDYGSSKDIITEIARSANFLISDYNCSILKSGSLLYLDCASTAIDIVEQLKITLYLQKWDNTQWVDISSWVYTKYNAKSLNDGTYSSYTTGNYYRVRAVHFAKNGSQTDSQNSTSSYIYIQ